MKISLQQFEIEAALRAHITSQGIATAGKSITFNFTMGRKGTGLTVDVDISAFAEKAVAATPTVITAQSTTTTVTPVTGDDPEDKPHAPPLPEMGPGGLFGGHKPVGG